MTGFTVTDGFSVIPPKRPVTVTVAVILMFVVTGLSFISGFALMIEDVLQSTDGFGSLFHEEFLWGLTFVVVAVVTTVFAMLVRGAVSGAQTATFTLLGGAAVLFLSTGFGRVAQLPFGDSGSGTSLLAGLVVLLGFVLTAAPVALLASPEASRWFRDRRREVTFIDAATSATRPLGFTIAIAFLGLTALLAITSVSVYIGWMATEGVAVVDTTGLLVEYFTMVGLPIVLLLLATIGLAFGSDLARIVAYGVCGYFSFRGVSIAVGELVGDLDPDNAVWIHNLDLALGLAASITAAVALSGLCQRQLLRWFDSRHTPPPPTA